MTREGTVEFIASYDEGRLHERNRCVRRGSRWFYLNAEDT